MNEKVWPECVIGTTEERGQCSPTPGNLLGGPDPPLVVLSAFLNSTPPFSQEVPSDTQPASHRASEVLLLWTPRAKDWKDTLLPLP